MEWVSKALDFVVNYSWAVFVVAVFVSFLPDGTAKQIGLLEIRESYKGFWWIVLVLSGAMWLGSAFRYVNKKFSIWRENLVKEKARRKEEEQRKTTIRNRLQSLDEEERMWIKYCLYHNTQSLSAVRVDRVAQSLKDKEILVEGSGSIMDLPFHIRDDVWEYLKANEDQFITQEEKQSTKFVQELEQFKRMRHPY